jgi:hypothetical protein
MGELIVKYDARKVKRDIRKVFNGDFLKIITEIVLNSDDSYKRLEQNEDIKTKKEIIIEIKRSIRTITITDHAEGMSNDDLKRIFTLYGGDHSKFSNNKNVRGLYGQGAGDVLFNAALSKLTASIISFKDNEISKCIFKFYEDRKIEIKNLKQNEKQLRHKYQMPGNGTIVEFGFDNSVNIPSKISIIDKIEEFYMLRYILLNPYRKIKLIDDKLTYELNANKYRIDHLVPIFSKSKVISFKFDNDQIEGVLKLYKKSSETLKYKVIIKDENDVVYDDTYFDFDKTPGIHYMTGVLELKGISHIIRKHLNSDDPKELLSDTRDGFDRRTQFTKLLYQSVEKHIDSAIKQLNQEKEDTPIDITNHKAFINIMKELNSYYKELELSSIGGLSTGKEPPADGLQFARQVISITKGKTYGLHLYINPKQIDANEVIEILCDNNENINIQTFKLSFQEEDIQDGIVKKQVIIQGISRTSSPIKLIAKSKNYETSVSISVIDEKIIYPENGLEFIPKKRTIIPNKGSNIILYFDTDYVPVNSIIRVTKEYTQSLFPLYDELIINETHLISETIGKIIIEVEPSSMIDELYINASFESITAQATIYFREPTDDDDGYDGLFSKIQLKFEALSSWQSQLDPKHGILYINGSHIINIANMGDLNQKDPKAPQFKESQQKYIFELITLEASKKIINQYIEKNLRKINDYETYLNEIQEEKTNLYKRINQKN